MNVLIVPGYGDARGYIDSAVKRWPERYGLLPHVQPFGWYGAADSYDTKWQAIVEVLQQMRETAIIGLSAGVGIALRALQDYPEIVQKVVFVSGPHRLSDLRTEVVASRYPLMAASLPPIKEKILLADRIMTLAPLKDGVVPPRIVAIEGAENHRMPIIGHALGLVWALKFDSHRIANFITGKQA